MTWRISLRIWTPLISLYHFPMRIFTTYKFMILLAVMEGLRKMTLHPSVDPKCFQMFPYFISRHSGVGSVVESSHTQTVARHEDLEPLHRDTPQVRPTPLEHAVSCQLQHIKYWYLIPSMLKYYIILILILSSALITLMSSDAITVMTVYCIDIELYWWPCLTRIDIKWLRKMTQMVTQWLTD